LEGKLMGENSAIEWTDHTFNPWMGCTRVSPACANCYAAVSTPARTLGLTWGPGEERRRTSAATWAQPLAWNRRAAAAGRRDKVFCASLADVFDNEVPDEWRADLFALIRRTPNLIWLLLTKRIGNAAKMAEVAGGLPENVWLGATVVNQAEADRDVPKLLATGGRTLVRFLSIEPMLGPIDLEQITLRAFGGPQTDLSNRLGDYVQPLRGNFTDSPRIGWVIVGGESGPGARPMHPDWARSLRDQCAAAGVPFLFKQWGEWARADQRPSGTAGRYAIATSPSHQGRPVFPVDYYPRMFDLFGGSTVMERVGKKVAGRLLDGVTHDEVPA
jgi:protein gp37